MRRILFSMALAVVALAVSCNNDEPTEDALLTLTSEAVVNVESDGGEVVINYTLTNAQQGATPSVLTAADWIAVKDKSNGAIVLKIAANNQKEERRAPVIVTYLDQRFDVEVVQAYEDPEGVGLELTSEPEVEVSRAGGALSITYSLKQDLIDEQISVVFEEDCDWVQIYNRDLYREVRLNVMLNATGVTRSTTVQLYYGGESVSVVLNQKGDGDYYFVASDIYGSYYGDKFSPGVDNYWFIFIDNGFNENGGTMPNSTFYRIDAYGDLYAGTDSEVPIPVGTYVLDKDNTYAHGTFAVENSGYFVTDNMGQHGPAALFDSGELIVEKGRMTLNVVINGEKHTVIYEGDALLSNDANEVMIHTNLVEDYTADLSNHHIIYANYGDFYDYGYQNWVFLITPNEGDGDNFQFDVITNKKTIDEGFMGEYVGSDVLKTNSYIYGFEFDSQMEGSWYFTLSLSRYAALRSGNMSLIDNGDNTVTLDIEVYDELRNRITGHWTGSWDDITPAPQTSSIVYKER